MYYVYLLQSEAYPSQRYVGYTTNLTERLKKHNEGGSPHTSKFRPWRLVAYLAFADQQGAVEFEKYLKSGSGKAFANKHLWNPHTPMTSLQLSRAQGCLLGQLAGDALGSLVEFKSPADIRRRHPNGVRDMADGGTWDTIAGQPTDDSEMALALARVLAERQRYDAPAARSAYRQWIDSHPFDCGATVAAGLRGRPNYESQANGALMRISPLGVFGANRDRKLVAEWAAADAALTHPHPVCQQANALYVLAIAEAVRDGISTAELHARIISWADEFAVEAALAEVIRRSASEPPRDYVSQQGWVLIALQNTLWQLLHAENVEEAIVDTIMRGGDTDTNAAICGALLGAVHGRDSIPQRWIDCLLACKPRAGSARVKRPRPECYWPVDVLELAGQLL